MPGCTSLAGIGIAVRSAQRAWFTNGYRRSLCLTGASAYKSITRGTRLRAFRITLEEFFKNQECLEKNRTNGEETLLAGPAREGLALLQGLLLCGTCGHALTVRYTGNGGIYPCYLCNRLRRDGLASKDCMSFRCDLLDAAIAEEVLKALQPAEIELALAALQELDQTLALPIERVVGRWWTGVRAVVLQFVGAQLVEQADNIFSGGFLF